MTTIEKENSYHLGSMNGPSDEIQTWVDVLSKDTAANRLSKRGGANKITITSNTPRPTKQSSRLRGGESDQVEILRSQVVSLLREKQELTKKVQSEKALRNQLEKDLEATRKTKQSNDKASVSLSSHDNAASLQLQVSTLREALDQTTHERNTLRDLLSKEKDQSNSFKSQLLGEERDKSVAEKKVNERDEEIEGLRAQLRHLRQELNTMTQLVSNKTGDNTVNKEMERLIQQNTHMSNTIASKQLQIDALQQGLLEERHVLQNLREELSESEDKLSKTERERDALQERLTAVETHRQLSMEQYQEEVETSVMAVTTQLEELLELNQQLQQELTSIQNEKDDLTSLLQKETDASLKWHKEKVQLCHQLTTYENKLTQLTSELQLVKGELSQQTTSSLVAIETLQSQLAEADNATKQITERQEASQSDLRKQLDTANKELEKRTQEAERTHINFNHQLTLVKQEKHTLISRLESIQSQYTKLKCDYNKLEEETISLHGDLSKCQRDKSTSEAQLVTLRAELSSVQEQCSQLKKELSDTRDFAQSHSRQQVENLTAQLVQKSQQLQDIDTDRKQLQSRVKKLECKLHEMALAHEVNSSKLQENIRTLTADYDSTHSQLETTQASNTQLQQKILDLEEEVAGWRRQLAERVDQYEDMTSLAETRAAQVKELESVINKLNEELIQSNTQKDHEKGSSLLSQVRSLQEAVVRLQVQRENLDAKLKTELERNRVAIETEQQLRTENTKLQELLNGSLSLNEKLQSSLELSSLDSSPSGAKNLSTNSLKLSPVSCSLNVQTPPTKHSSMVQVTSPATEILHLKQQLAEARQTCLKLEKQQAQDTTEMAKVQGSLQALLKIQEHLSSENKSLGQSFANVEEEREAYKQEAKKLGSELVSAQENNELVNSSVNRLQEYLLNQLRELVGQVTPLSELHSKLSEYQQQLEQSNNSMENLKTTRKLLETLCTAILQQSQQLSEFELENKILHDQVNSTVGDSGQRHEELTCLQEKVSVICEQTQQMEKELEKREKELEEKTRQIAELQIELNEREQTSSVRRKKEQDWEATKKDLETQYQAKLTVLRGNLMEREEEVSSLQTVEQQLKIQLNEAEMSLVTTSEELAEAKIELQTLNRVLTQYEECMKRETGILENEIEKQGNDVMAMKVEAGEMKESSQVTFSVNQAQEKQLKTCNDRVNSLQAEVEMLRAKKSVIEKYLQTHELSQQEATAREREELIQENDQLGLENEDLRQELASLSETTQRMHDEVEILVLRLQEVQEEAEEERKLQQRQLEEKHHQEWENEIHCAKLELKGAQNELQRHNDLLETEVERARVQLRRVEEERDRLTRELRILKDQLVSLESEKGRELATLQQRIDERDAIFADMQSTVEQTLADKEALELRLNESCSDDGSLNNTKKVDKLKAKLKQQVRQTNHLRMKLGYSLSELRLYKQLKKELDNQVNQLQHALTLSQQQYQRCLEKLYQAERLDLSTSFTINTRET